MDLTAAMRHEWKQATLPFVAGLGPRKARALMRVAAGDGNVESRQVRACLTGLIAGVGNSLWSCSPDCALLTALS